MTRERISLTIPDVSAFARTLKSNFDEDLGEASPGHQTLLNAIARAGGYRNFQHLKATHGPADPVEPPETRALTRAMARFDEDGLLTDWPSKRKTRQHCLWALWAQVPPRKTMSEKEISALFDTMMCYRDAAQVRRSLVEDKLLIRNRDGSQYTRVEATPDATSREVIRAVKARRLRKAREGYPKPMFFGASKAQ